jgi:hypothetical protein
MTPDRSIVIRLVNANSEPLSLGNVDLEVNFFMKRNYRYGFKVGRTNESGVLNVSYTDIEKLRRKDAEQNLMDYNSRLEDCDSEVEIVIPSEKMLREEYNNALRGYGVPPAWAKHWPSNDRIEASPRKVEVNGPTTDVFITCKLL